ncbi:S-layer homology domain-containing protein [Arthrobacter gengyunqii]|uniref:S-layer homology domain-containing protein n=1 Tax=Arthrobacter gengyunqii TaxID=2886940 RepID=A0ABS8GH88_9MICC|nr:S-layer homology domain-containing protein [Arthrobacter gengyunqii]MCC3265905.1 S-layer homology domain-containing protein [Arthrobacter gengyunqii]
MNLLPTSGRNAAKAAAALALTGVLAFGTVAPAVAADPQTPGASSVQPAAVAGSPFKDVTWNTQYAKEILWVAQSGISTGWSDGTYRPLAPVSREAMAAFMHRLDALKGSKDDLPDSVPAFNDVANSQFRGEIGWLLGSGVTTGYPDGSFRPGASVNRDAMAAYLYRMAGYPEFTPPKTSPFKDVSTSNQFYREISWLASTGISTGWTHADGSRTYAPLQPVARDAMAAFMYRFAEKGYVPKA